MSDRIVQLEKRDGMNRGRHFPPLPAPVSAVFVGTDATSLHDFKRQLSAIANLDVTFLSLRQVSEDLLKEQQLLLLQVPDDLDGAAKYIQQLAPLAQNTLVIGSEVSSSLMRSALKYGVTDFIPSQDGEEELYQAIRQIAEQIATACDLGPLISVVNAKGGAGASFISVSLADQLARRLGVTSALLDGDLLHASQLTMVQGTPDYFFQDALRGVSELDETAIKGLMSSAGDIAILPSHPFSSLMPEQFDFMQLPTLLHKLRATYRHTVVDLSRGPEHWSIPLIQQSDAVLLVVQDNVMCLKDAADFINYFVAELGIEKQRIHVVLNRFQKGQQSLSQKEVKKALRTESLFTISNDFSLASRCMEEGVPPSRVSGKNRISKELDALCQLISGAPCFEPSKGLWNRLMSR